jgi:hypothetical protein
MTTRTIWLLLRAVLYLLRMTEHPQPGNLRMQEELVAELAALPRPIV